MQLMEDDAELDLGLAQLLQQRRRISRAPRRLGSDHGFLGEAGYICERLMLPLLFWRHTYPQMWPKLRILQFQARSSSGNFCVETECRAKMGLLFIVHPKSYKTRRQLVYCRIDVVTTRRNVVVNPSYLDIIPNHVAASLTGSVITHTMPPWSTGCPEHARVNDNRRNVYENCKPVYERVMRSVREKLRPLWTPSCGEIFKPFKNLVGSPRHCTRYGDMLREQPT